MHQPHHGVFELAVIDYAAKAAQIAQNPLPGNQQAQRAQDLAYLQYFMDRDHDAQEDGEIWVNNVTMNPDIYLVFNRILFDYAHVNEPWVWDVFNSGSARAGCTGDPQRPIHWRSDMGLAVPPTPAYRIRHSDNVRNHWFYQSCPLGQPISGPLHQYCDNACSKYLEAQGQVRRAYGMEEIRLHSHTGIPKRIMPAVNEWSVELEVPKYVVQMAIGRALVQNIQELIRNHPDASVLLY